MEVSNRRSGRQSQNPYLPSGTIELLRQNESSRVSRTSIGFLVLGAVLSFTYGIGTERHYSWHCGTFAFLACVLLATFFPRFVYGIWLLLVLNTFIYSQTIFVECYFLGTSGTSKEGFKIDNESILLFGYSTATVLLLIFDSVAKLPWPTHLWAKAI